MQTNPFQIKVPKPIFPSLVNLSAVHRPSPSRPLLKPLRVIAISSPNGSTTPTTTVSTPDVVDDSVAAFWDYQFLFISQFSETTELVKLLVVEGAIPPEFHSGTYYLIGPGLFSDDHGSTVHPLDGHGYLRAFSFGKINGDEVKVKFMAKYVKTEVQVEEHDPAPGMWRFIHRKLHSQEHALGGSNLNKDIYILFLTQISK